MRVTQGLLFGQAVDGVHRHTSAILQQQQQISSGKRWTRPSEDPTAAAQSITSRDRRTTLERYESSVTEVKDRLSSTASAIQLLSSVLVDAKEVATNSVNSTLTGADRKSLAQRIDSVIAQVLEVANRRDKYGALFSGTASGTPYEQNGANVTYQGNDGTQIIAIGDTLSISTNVTGNDVFATEARGVSLYFGGGTGAAAGTGTDSGLDRGTLTIGHGVTTYGTGTGPSGGDTVSGVRPASTSAALDTVIGPAGAHKLTIDAVAKTIKLNNGDAVSYTGSETDLAVNDGSGGIVHLDATGIGSSFQGQVSIASTGSLTTDGSTFTAVNFSGNQVLVNSADGSTTNVNTTNVRYAGRETIDYAGTSDLFQTLAGLRDDLLNYDSLPAQSRDQSIQSRSRELNRNYENVLVALADVGSRVKIAETASERLGEMKDQISIVISDLEDVDLADVVVDYNKAQLALQLAQAAGQRLMQTNYLAFLQ